jgi:hypothetical protein
MSRDLAPIALFTFKRPEHTARTLEALARNPEFARSELHIFCDGSRRPDEDAAVEATREVARKCVHPNKMIYEAPANRGLAASIVDGVSRLCAQHGRVIVVEDDLVVAPVFLDFLNRGLDRYSGDEQVMQISGHMFPVEFPPSDDDAVFLPFTTSWGWATWQRAWSHFDPAMLGYNKVSKDRVVRRRFDLDNSYPYLAMLKKQKAGKIDSWAIRWYLSVFLRDGLVLFPRRSLVNNEGFDGSGTHCADDGGHKNFDLPTLPLSVEIEIISTNENAKSAVADNLYVSRGALRTVFDFYQRTFVK